MYFIAPRYSRRDAGLSEQPSICSSKRIKEGHGDRDQNWSRSLHKHWQTHTMLGLEGLLLQVT